MAKRHHKSSRMEMDPRRIQEMRDAGMINEDHSATANLPQDVKYHAWPDSGHYARWDLDDTIRGINKQENEDGAGMKRHQSKTKY